MLDRDRPSVSQTHRIARWCWRLLPPHLRYWLYRQYSGWPQRPSWHFLQPIRHACRKVTLANHRATARAYWPDLTRTELVTAAVLMAALRFHSAVLRAAWAGARVLRRHSTPRDPGDGPLTLLHVTSSFDLGGTQRQIVNLCESSTARHRHYTTEIFPELNFLYRRGHALDIGRYVTGGLIVRTLGRFVTNLGTRSPQLIQTYKLVRDFQSSRPDVVIGWGHELSASTFLAAAIARVPAIVFCIRTFNPTYGWTTPAMQRLLHAAHRRMTPYVAAVISNSTVLREDHTRWLGFAPHAFHVCANGIDVVPLSDGEIAARRAVVRRELGLSSDTFVVANVGRFSSEKGQQLLVEVDSRLSRDYPPARMAWVLCGDGPTLESVRASAVSRGLSNIIFVGRTDRVRDYLCAADAFVMPSDFEGMPNAMMEAMGHGLPCVSTNRSGALDVARDGIEALYCEPGDVARIEQHLRYLLEHRAEARAMGQRAQQRLREFSVSRFVAHFEDTVDASIRAVRREHRISLQRAPEQSVAESTRKIV